MAMVWNSVRRGSWAVALPALLSRATAMADRSRAILMPSFEARHFAPAIDWRSRLLEFQSSSWNAPSDRRSLFIDATTQQVALQTLSGSEEGEHSSQR